MTENVSTGSIFDSHIPEDIIKGWNDRRQSSNQIISGLMPFVQLIGIFNKDEYEKMFEIRDEEGETTGSFLNRRQVYYTSDNGQTDALGTISKKGEAADDASSEIMEAIRTQLEERFINLYIASGQGEGEESYLAITPEDGILMAEAAPQTVDGTGGIGITDLQVDNGINNFKTMTIRLTVNDPQILNNRPEYAKMSTLQGEFLIMYGWSNPESVAGYDNTPPPKFEVDPQEPSKLMLRVPLGAVDNGGYWSAQRMNITGYDFSFNELGQMEISLKLMGKTEMFLATTRLSTISKTWRRLMGTYDYDPGDVGAAKGGFGAIKVTTDDGTEVDLATAALNEQKSYFPILGSVAENNSTAAAAIDISLSDLGYNNKSISESIGDLEGESQPYTGNRADQNLEELIRRRRERESLGYPYAPGLSVYEKVIRRVAVDEAGDVNPDEDNNGEAAGPDEEALNTKPITDYKARLTYYYLGWVMDGVKLSISDRNRRSLLSGQNKITPKFAYMATTPDSNITSAFQSKIRRANSTEINKRIQDAIIRLKEKCMPPFLSRPNTVDPAIQRVLNNNESTGIIRSERFFPCRGQTIVDGLQSEEMRGLAQALFPAPIGAPVELPHRGFIRIVNFLNPDEDNDQDRELARRLQEFDDNNNTNFLSVARDNSSFDGQRGVHRFFIPDWYRYYDDDGNPTGGSEDGFDPLNPSDYMAADRGGRFFYLVNYDVLRTFNNNRTTSIEEYTRVIEVDQYRQQNAEIWNLTQRRWHNLYITYLGGYFEQVIRQRIGELEEEGKTIEDIYNEPVDLDFLTSKQYRNDRFRSDSSDRFGGNDEQTSIPPVAEGANMRVDEDLLDAISRAEDRLPSLQQQKASVEQARNELAVQIGEKVDQIKALQSVETSSVLDREDAGIEQLTGGRYSREAFNSDGTLKSNIKMNIEPLGRSGVSVSGARQRSNYGYSGNPVQRDPAGNLVYSGFSNFLRNIRGNQNPRNGIYQTIIELSNLEDVQTPTVTREYILYALYGARTNNFRKSDSDQGNEQLRFINEATPEGVLENFFLTGLDVDNDGDVDFDDFFIIADDFNPSDYREQRVDNIVEELQTIVNQKLAQITRLTSELQPLYAQYETYSLTLEAADSQIADANATLSQYNSYILEDGLSVRPLSLYDDTSDFDDVLEVPMGRAQPMRLETKVAQQWYRMFSGIVQRGAGDVTNYGPAKGGTIYYPPSNVKTFRYDENKRGKDIFGVPKIILDPIEFKKTNQTQSLVESASTITTLSDEGVQPTDAEVEAAREAGGLPPVESTEAYVNWQIFGNPEPPNSPNAAGTNSYGFRTGPPIEEFDSQGKLINISGGNYVKDYQAFLDLFNVDLDPTLGDDYTIIGNWPSSNKDTPYYMIDEANNIIIENAEGWYQQSGWYLGSGGFPVYLYPSREMATQIDPTKTTPAMPFGTPNGEYGLTSQGNEGTPMGWGDVDDDGKGGGHWDDKAKSGERNDLLNQLGREYDQSGDGKPQSTLTKNRQEGWDDDYDALKPGEKGSPLMNVGTPTEPILSTTFPQSIGQQFPTKIQNGDFTSYGARIGRGEHCMNLTLDMKRALVIKRKNWYFPPAKGNRNNKVFWSLGDDDPTAHNGSPGSAGAQKVDWSKLTKKTVVDGEVKIFDYWIHKDDPQPGSGNMIPVYAMPGSTQPSIDAYEPTDETLGSTSIILYRPRRGASVQGPRVNKTQGYSNQYYPYGTGRYQNGKAQYGSAAFPEKKPNKNWLYIGDFLDRLPGRGFFTKINNNNNSPTQLLPSGEIVDGEELNTGFVSFIIQNVLAPLPKNRRIGSRSGDNTPRGKIKVVNSRWAGDKDEWRLQDVTYGHLFRPEDDENEDIGSLGPQFTDLSAFTIDNVADIPIRRDVIENLMNKQNNNMSIYQFMQQVMRPDSIGVEGKNINVGFRTRSDGVMEVFSASKNWRNTAQEASAEIDEAIFNNRYPERHLLLDYKKNDSLIERLDMNSKFDPGMTMTFELGAQAFAGNPNKFAQFLSFGNVAVELRDFLLAEDPQYKDIVQIAEGGDDAKGEAGRVTIAKNAFFSDDTSGPTVPSSLVTKFLMQNPERMAKLNAMLVADSGANFATQLLSNYMRKTTVTIHGTTNIFPNSTIYIRGVVPQLEGMYIVNNVRESVTPSGFQTILEATLVVNKNLEEDGSYS